MLKKLLCVVDIVLMKQIREVDATCFAWAKGNA